MIHHGFFRLVVCVTGALAIGLAAREANAQDFSDAPPVYSEETSRIRIVEPLKIRAPLEEGYTVQGVIVKSEPQAIPVVNVLTEYWETESPLKPFAQLPRVEQAYKVLVVAEDPEARFARQAKAAPPAKLVPCRPRLGGNVSGIDRRNSSEELFTQLNRLTINGDKDRHKAQVLAKSQDLKPEDHSGDVFPTEVRCHDVPIVDAVALDENYFLAPADFCHAPLYFEEVGLERFGQHRGVWQPLVSGARFYSKVPLLPYLSTVDRFRSCCSYASVHLSWYAGSRA